MAYTDISTEYNTINLSYLCTMECTQGSFQSLLNYYYFCGMGYLKVEANPTLIEWELDVH